MADDGHVISLQPPHRINTEGKKNKTINQEGRTEGRKEVQKKGRKILLVENDTSN